MSRGYSATQDPKQEIQRFPNLGYNYVKMISKLYTIISNKLLDLSLNFGDLYDGHGSLQVSKKLWGLVNGREFEQWKHIEIIVLAICWRLSAFKSPSHEKSIFLKIHSFFPSNFFSGPQMINELPGFWISWSLKNCDIIFYKPKLE